ncbi:DUF4124 domain-containing protein [Chromobacterium sp. CV08]|uniref:DUF4124 domain-containing protein n=1 Tax=Chromobacterium sp. CV08 TaxID=3133274 RepID=UPI003DA8B78C
MKTLAGLSLLLCSLAQAGVYKWVDETGKTHYSDAPPLQSQSRGVSELSRQGAVTRQAETEAQRQAREASAAAARQALQQRQEQQRHDQALSQSYPSLADLKADRQKQLSALQSALRALELRAQGLALQQRNLQKDADLAARQHQPPRAAAQHDLQVLQHEQKDIAAMIAAKRAEIDAYRQKMQQDLLRYQQLNAR